MVEELQNFRIKFTKAGNDTYEAWRESDHNAQPVRLAMPPPMMAKKVSVMPSVRQR